MKSATAEFEALVAFLAEKGPTRLSGMLPHFDVRLLDRAVDMEVIDMNRNGRIHLTRVGENIARKLMQGARP